MAFTYPPSLVGISNTQTDVQTKIAANYAGGQPGQLHKDTHKPAKEAAINDYLVKETTED